MRVAVNGLGIHWAYCERGAVDLTSPGADAHSSNDVTGQRERRYEVVTGKELDGFRCEIHRELMIPIFLQIEGNLL